MRHCGLAVLVLAIAVAGLQGVCSGRSLQAPTTVAIPNSDANNSTSNSTGIPISNSTSNSTGVPTSNSTSNSTGVPTSNSPSNATSNATSNACNASLFGLLSSQPELTSLAVFAETLLVSPYAQNVSAILNTTEPYTLFAPNGAAFLKLLDALAQYNATDLLLDPNIQLAILLTHIVPAPLRTSDIQNNTVASTLVGVNLTFAITNSSSTNINNTLNSTSGMGMNITSGIVLNSTNINSTTMNSTSQFNSSSINSTNVNETITTFMNGTDNSTSSAITNSTSSSNSTDSSSTHHGSSRTGTSTNSSTTSTTTSSGTSNTSIITVISPGSNATILTPDLCFNNNSFVQVIDNVLLPAPVEGVIPLYYRLASNSNFTLLTAAIDLVSIAAQESDRLFNYRAFLSSPGASLTLFAPDDQAFKQVLNASTPADVAINFGILGLNDLLAVHVVPDILLAVTPGANFTTLGNVTTSFQQQGNQTVVANSVSSAPLLDYALSTINGVAYPIRGVLFPPQA